MFTENTEDVKFRRNHSPATMYDNSNKIIKFFMVYCIIRLGKKTHDTLHLLNVFDSIP